MRPVRVLCCSDGFKGTLEAKDVGESVIAALPQDVRKIARNIPATDGGTGFLAAMVAAKNVEVRESLVHGPFGDKLIHGKYGVSEQGKFAVVEMALVAGLPMIPERLRDPRNTTTFGVGELMVHIAKNSPTVTKIYVGLGGSSTNDAAIPMMQAMGLLRARIGSKWYNQKSTPLLGGNLIDIDELVIIEEARRNFPKIVLVSDVSNPFLGPRGATAVFSPQKGATNPGVLAHLENGLHRIANLLEKSHPHIQLRDMRGGGAAGGMSGGLVAIAGAEWKAGAETFMELCNMREHFAWADVIITGEGSFDAQTSEGKTISAIQKLCDGMGKKLVVICGMSVGGAQEALPPGSLVYALISKFSLNEAMTNPAKCIMSIVSENQAEILSIRRSKL